VALFCITFPAIYKVLPPEEHVTLVAPVIPQWKPKVIPPPPVVQKRVFLKEQPVVLPKPKPAVIPPPVVKRVEPPRLLAKAPELEKPIPAAQPLPEQKMAPPAPPKPDVKTGVFNSSELAKGAREPHQVKTGGFGDPNGVPASNDSRPAQLVMARLGGFDMPEGAGHGGGGGHAQSGGVKAAGFGSSGDPNGVPGGTGTHGTVRTGGFGDNTATTPTHTGPAQVATPSTTPVEILFKPKPSYSDEARNLHLEGQVALNVTFTANGAVKVVRVVHGLGHGLDEAAQQAAAQVRFKPATRGGVPVDTDATIYITFQLT
jgi:TonB family protein